MSFQNLKKNSGNLDRLTKQLETRQQKYTKDERFWGYELDKTGVAYATFRFIPDPNGDSFVRYYEHKFEKNGKWFIENCPRTIEQSCPVCMENTQLWNTGTNENKAIASMRKKKLSCVSNIFIVDDPSNKENVGKVFLFKFGAKILTKIEACLKPKFAVDKPFNPFDIDSGHNFIMKVCKVDGQVNYDQSSFGEVSPLAGGNEKEQEAIWKQTYDLAPFVHPSKFKSFDELKVKLDRLYNTAAATTTRVSVAEHATDLAPHEDSEPGDATDGDDDALASLRNMVDEKK